MPIERRGPHNARVKPQAASRFESLNGLAAMPVIRVERARVTRTVGGTVQRDLVEAARLGDHEAFQVLASSAGDRLYAIARLTLRDAHLAEDAVQDALVHAWRKLPTLRDPDRWDAWLYRLIV